LFLLSFATVLSSRIQEEDVDEFYSGSGITWILSIQEARVVAGLKL
jgi:hypothetical protein